MCALFEIKTSSSVLEKKLINFSGPAFEIDQLVLPYDSTKILTLSDGSLRVVDMSFSLIPSWSKTKKVKFATHNARIETLLEKPTWRVPLESMRSIVAMTSFIEPIYENELAGNMVKFSQINDDLFFVAALYDRWIDKVSGHALESFAIVTKPPGGYIKSVGHDRSPIFLNSKSSNEWLAPQNKNGQSLIDFLHSLPDIELTASIHRPLKNSGQLSFF
jgi:putative SOS response-associated peptidase YedK